ncbi:MAG TPA: DegT/DnrJ/EryC1/StrS aminotransferase family protein, partial [Candidatus Polarisedimenticolia bacterium]|nr:DegT/DnrJ/EryC1/StrS aminotransferase family protein [Candidatus Polarisedimenticolia bacterium]
MPPASRDEWLPFHRPSLDARDVDGVVETLRSGWLTTGPRVRLLEERIAALVGARHAIGLNSCTAALHLALAAAGVKPGDEVLTSPYTFAATGEAILYLGARPRFADIDPATLNLDPGQVARRMTRRTTALVPVHIAGLPCDLGAIRAAAGRRRVPVIEDAAHALGASIGKRAIGSISEMTCFSFYATKNLATGEGGMITVGDRALAERLRRLSLHGLSRDAWKRYTRAGSWRYDVVELGYKDNLTDVAAAIGLVQLSKFARMQRLRRALARRYSRLLAQEEAFETPPEIAGTTHAWHLYILRLRPGILKVGRDRFCELLGEAGIGHSVHFLPLHLFSFYRKTFGYRRGDFPHTERESARAFSLPLHPGLSLADQDRIVGALLTLAARLRR